MKKEEIIEIRGVGGYKKMLEQSRQWWLDNSDKARKHHEEQSRKGGKYYLKMRRYESTGVQGARQKIRRNHRFQWRRYKMIIAPGSQIHHEWISGTSQYRGVALVEADQHRHGNIDVIRILDGKITVLTEAELKVKIKGEN